MDILQEAKKLGLEMDLCVCLRKMVFQFLEYAVARQLSVYLNRTYRHEFAGNGVHFLADRPKIRQMTLNDPDSMIACPTEIPVVCICVCACVCVLLLQLMMRIDWVFFFSSHVKTDYWKCRITSPG